MTLELDIPTQEVFDEVESRFVVSESAHCELEHSLYAVAKWESEYCKPFPLLNGKTFETPEEMMYYVHCMDTLGNFDPMYLENKDVIQDIIDYLGKTPSATVIKDEGPNSRGSFTTSEVIYASMFGARMPLECEHWNIYRLMKTLQVIASNNKPKKKMSQKEILERQRKLNAERRAKLNSKG